MGAVGSHSVAWIAGVAVVLLMSAAIVGLAAIRGLRRAPLDRTGARPRAGVAVRAAISTLAVLGWVILLTGVGSGLSPLTRDTVAGTPIAAPPELIQAGVPTTSAKPHAPDPLAALRIGDCVEVPIEQASDPTGAPSWKAGAPDPVECTSLDANYRVVQTGPAPCSDPLWHLESSRHNKAGALIYHLCLAFDWRTGFCYDTAHLDEPSKVDCGTPGDHIVQATAVLENTVGGGSCPRDGAGAVWVVWDQRRLTVCFRGSDRPGP